MKTKFIEGTNEQYSIREDGEVIRHYKLTWKNKITKVEDKIMTKYGRKYSYHVVRRINDKNHGWSINTLLFKYFNFKYCTACGEKLYHKNVLKCKNCLDKTTRIYNKKHLKEKMLWSKINNRDKISRYYACSILGLKSGELTDEMYLHYKRTLNLKRRICQKHNIHITKFNY